MDTIFKEKNTKHNNPGRYIIADHRNSVFIIYILSHTFCCFSEVESRGLWPRQIVNQIPEGRGSCYGQEELPSDSLQNAPKHQEKNPNGERWDPASRSMRHQLFLPPSVQPAEITPRINICSGLEVWAIASKASTRARGGRGVGAPRGSSSAICWGCLGARQGDGWRLGSGNGA